MEAGGFLTLRQTEVLLTKSWFGSYAMNYPNAQLS